jgi:hypothetical protein
MGGIVSPSDERRNFPIFSIIRGWGIIPCNAGFDVWSADLTAKNAKNAKEKGNAFVTFARVGGLPVKCCWVVIIRI